MMPNFRPALVLAALAVLAAGPAAHAASPSIDLTTFTPPALDSLPDDPYGRLVRDGHALTVETYRLIGPEVADKGKRYAGNNLACQSCHLNAATQPYAMPWTGVFAVFPKYRARENAISTIEERINGCMQRSMNGKPLPLDSREMKAFMAYMHFLSTDVPVGATVIGSGTKEVKEPSRAADAKRGAQVFADNCAVCHGDGGQGKRRGVKGDALGYEFPPLWGPDSYNDGAGMYRLLTGMSFALHNMPLGTTHDAPALSVDDAYDAMAFVNSQKRPHKAALDQDFPDRLRKPVDMPFPPFADGLPAEQHKYGPFEPIRAKLKELRKAAH